MMLNWSYFVANKTELQIFYVGVALYWDNAGSVVKFYKNVGNVNFFKNIGNTKNKFLYLEPARCLIQRQHSTVVFDRPCHV